MRPLSRTFPTGTVGPDLTVSGRPIPLDGPPLRFHFPVKFCKDTPETNSKDYSGIGILLSNVLVIIYALVDGWDLPLMMVIYWAQSVIIGIFHFFRILLLRSFSTDGSRATATRPETAEGKRSTALFFAVHYGLFHLVYATFLFLPNIRAVAEGGFWILVSVVGFLAGHAYSFLSECQGRPGRKAEPGNHDVPPLRPHPPDASHHHLRKPGAAGDGQPPPFSGLKTFADYVMHIVEHRVLQKPAGKGKKR